MSSSHERYRAARDVLLGARGNENAVAEFEWPTVDAPFSWAHDRFDPIADGVDRTTLVIAEEDGSVARSTLDEMRRRSNGVVRSLAGVGVRRGDGVLLMLGNQVELWEAMLVVMKLGAAIMPTTTALGRRTCATASPGATPDT
ncbi:AMP-binding protein [Pseudonocardia sp. RS010]|uniref:AMP-binding protein n=1 Tax=Pseudonocardia sp. RS010 TaxID=3385979 RepID=UPI0039A06DDA